jgi:hypothetical protein
MAPDIGTRVFDGVSDRAIERASVVVEGMRIREVVVGARWCVTPGCRRREAPSARLPYSHLVSELGRLYRERCDDVLPAGTTRRRHALRDAETGRAPGPRVFSLGPLLDGAPRTIPRCPGLSTPRWSAWPSSAPGGLSGDWIILTQKPALGARAAVDGRTGSESARQQT